MATSKYPRISEVVINPELGKKSMCVNSGLVNSSNPPVPAPAHRSSTASKLHESPEASATARQEVRHTRRARQLNPLAAMFTPSDWSTPARTSLPNLAASEPSDEEQAHDSTPRIPDMGNDPADVHRDIRAMQRKTKSQDQATHSTDELDRLVDQAAAQLRAAASWTQFFHHIRDAKGDWGQVENIDHPARHLLTHYKQHGVPVKSQQANWTDGRKQAALNRGPHKSANDHMEFLRAEYCDMIKKGHWVLLPADSVIDMPELQLSPLGVVPQRERRPRTISDYSYFGVNDDTVKLAPAEAMQFGKALPRLLRYIHEANPRFGPVHLAKIDIADGFYRMNLRPVDALRLGVLFPTRPGERKLIGIPLVLPMGWSESPPAFCASTETVADLANDTITTDWTTLDRPHRLDQISESPVEPDRADQITKPIHATPVPPHRPPLRQSSRPLQQWDVYVDDFLGFAQGNQRTRKKIKRALLHALDKVFRPLEPDDNPMRQEPASLKKLRKGDGTWSTRKTMLGWDIDTVKRTIELPPHRVERLQEILNSIPYGQRAISTKNWHKVLGELRSMSLALPGSKGLFSLLQEAFRHEELDRPRLRLTKGIHEVLNDFRWLVNDLASRPTRIAELVPDAPTVIGACDAAKGGMGGVFFVRDDQGTAIPHLWRRQFPNSVQRRFVSFDNPTGTINNSDLELCGNLAHQDVIARTFDVREHTVHTLSDNVAAVYWLRKGRAMATMQPQRADKFRADLELAQEAVRQGVGSHYAKRKDTHWVVWLQFCTEYNFDPFLANIEDPVPVLQVFAKQYRTGEIAPRKKTVTSRYVADVVCSIGQAFQRMGAPDPRLSAISGEIDFRLKRQLRCYHKEDPPPTRVKPVPVQLVRFLINAAHGDLPTTTELPPGNGYTAIADMICIAFYFLLRTSEYAGNDPEHAVFTLDDVHLYLGSRKLCLRTALDRDIESATSMMRLVFTTQKNQRKGDVIAHARSGDPYCCPVTATIRLILGHRNHFRRTSTQFDGTVRFASYYHHESRLKIRYVDITSQLRYAARMCFLQTGIDPREISARSLRAGGAMALLCGKVDDNQIRLLGRWHSDAMMRYLHQEATPIMKNLARIMFNDGGYDFLPTAAVAPLLH